MRAVLYARVSSEKQAEKDLSISAQLRELRSYAAQHDFDVVQEFVDEAESARTANRPKFQEMISWAKQKDKPFDVILVWKLSRFARNREDSIIYKSLLRKRGIQVVSIVEKTDDTPAGKLLEGVIEVIDEFYSANLSQDTKRGLKENARRGFCNGGRPPFGYKRKQVREGSASRITLEPDPVTAPVVQDIFSMCLSGKGAKEIAKTLNVRRIRTNRGQPFNKWGVIYILRNPTYIGRYVYARNRRLPPGEEHFEADAKATPLISPENFAKAQGLIHDRSAAVTAPRRVNSSYLLSGLAVCGHCGSALQGGTAKSGHYRYYACYNYLRKGKTVCHSKMVNAGTIEARVIEALKLHLLNEEHLTQLVRLTNEELSKQNVQVDRDITVAEQQRTERQGRLERLFDLIETGQLSTTDLSPRIQKLRQEIEDFQREIQGLRHKRSANPVMKPMTRAEIAAYVADLRSLLDEGSFFEQRSFLKSFITAIRVNRPEVIVEYKLPLTKKPPFNTEVLSTGKLSGQ